MCPVADELSRRACWKAGERGSYQPLAGHTVLWTAVGMGPVVVPDEVRQGELVAFRPSSAVIEFDPIRGMITPCLGFPLVHTNTEARISAIQTRLQLPES